MKNHLALLAIAFSLTALLFVGCANDDEDNNPTNVPPATPSNLAAAQTVRTQVNLSWSNVADEDSFLVQRSVDSTSWAVFARVASDVLTTVDTGILANQKHWYRVASKNIAGPSAASAPVSIWTWPAIYNFSTDQTDQFAAQSVDGPPDYHIWEWDATAGAGKLTVSIVDPSQFWVDVSSYDTMPNQGWFETKVKIESWATDDTIYYGVCRDISNSANVIALKFTQNFSIFYYRDVNGTANTIATNPQVPLMMADAFHTIRLFRQDTQWILYFDGNQVASSSAPNTAVGTYGLVQEWWYDRGSSPEGDHMIWLDDVASNAATPALLQSGSSHSPHRSSLDSPRRPVKK